MLRVRSVVVASTACFFLAAASAAAQFPARPAHPGHPRRVAHDGARDQHSAGSHRAHQQHPPGRLRRTDAKTLATATVDRLLYHAHVLLTDGTDSYRLARATAGKGVRPFT